MKQAQLSTLHFDEQVIAGSSHSVYIKEHNIPGSVKYAISRHALPQRISEDAGMMIYHYNAVNPEENFLELKYCISGNKYCKEKTCDNCDQKPTSCKSQLDTTDLFTFHFPSSFLYQFTHNVKISNKKDEVLAFKHAESFTQTFALCAKKRNVLDALLNHCYTGSLENIFVNSKIHELLLYSMDCLVGEEKVETFACKFLNDERSRDQIYEAKEILLQHIGNPITIKELSRKVAMNECYLKKGFKEIFGTTIFDFYQQQRMEHAKYLLYDKSLSVTDVSALLGYSSISHFSAAFKKHTGIKPCELLK